MSVTGSNNAGRSTVMQRIRLRRAVNKDMIQQNLQHMQRESHRKKLAQALYYGQMGQSPLTRNGEGEGLGKQPVHERLGSGPVKLRRVPIFGTNTTSILPKSKFQKITLRNAAQSRQLSVRNFRNQRLARASSIQNRLARIRGGYSTSGVNSNQTAQKVRLRRAAQPTNYQIQITNTNLTTPDLGSNTGYTRHSIKRFLTPSLQEEIRMIQEQTKFNPPIIYDMDLPVFVSATGTSINERFTITCN